MVSLDFLTTHEVNKKVQEYYYSRDWWIIFPGLGEEDTAFVDALQRRFYGKPSTERGFVTLVHPSIPSLSCYFAKKAYCSPEQLSKLLKKHAETGTDLARLDEGADILLGFNPAASQGADFLKRCQAWLQERLDSVDVLPPRLPISPN